MTKSRTARKQNDRPSPTKNSALLAMGAIYDRLFFDDRQLESAPSRRLLLPILEEFDDTELVFEAFLTELNQKPAKERKMLVTEIAVAWVVREQYRQTNSQPLP